MSARLEEKRKKEQAALLTQSAAQHQHEAVSVARGLLLSVRTNNNNNNHHVDDDDDDEEILHQIQQQFPSLDAQLVLSAAKDSCFSPLPLPSSSAPPLRRSMPLVSPPSPVREAKRFFLFIVFLQIFRFFSRFFLIFRFGCSVGHSGEQQQWRGADE
jgi:hypothetical protein